MQEIGDIFKQLSNDIGLTVLLVEQKFPIVLHIADNLSILGRGRKVASGQIADLTDDLISKYLTV